MCQWSWNGGKTLKSKTLLWSFRQVLEFGDQPGFPIDYAANRVKDALDQMCYEGDYPPTIKKLLPPFWRFLAHTFVSCISGRKGGSDEISQTATLAIVSLVMDWEYNYSKYVLEEMKSNLLGKKKDSFLMYPRFLQMIFDEEYPQLERTADTLDVKVLGPNSFSLMTQSRKNTKVVFQGKKPLVKLGRFADKAGEEMNTPTMEQNLESTSSKSPINIPRQFTMEEVVHSDDEDTEPGMTEQEFEALIQQSVPEVTLEEAEAERVRQVELNSNQSAIDETEENVEPASTLVQRKRKRSDTTEEVQVPEDQPDTSAPVNVESSIPKSTPVATEPSVVDKDVQENVERSVPSPLIESTPMDEDKDDQDKSEKQVEEEVIPAVNIEDAFVRTETDRVAGGSSMPEVIPIETDYVAGSSSMQAGLNTSKGKTIAFDAGLVDVVQLQSRIFELEQEPVSKDVMIGNLDIRVNDIC